MQLSGSMKRFRFRYSLAGLCLFSVALASAQDIPPTQTDPILEQLAGRTAETVVKTQKRQIFVAQSAKCQFDEKLCLQFEQVLVAAVRRRVPNAQFMDRADILRVLGALGFTADDAEDEEVLALVSGAAGTEALLIVDLAWKRGGYELRSAVYDVGRRKKISDAKARKVLFSSASAYSDEPLFYTNPATGISRILLRNPKPTSVVSFPECISCSEPEFSEEMRTTGKRGMVILRATITQQGLPVDIRAVTGFSQDAAEHTVRAIQTWRFKPGTAPDGTPLATRTVIQVTYR